MDRPSLYDCSCNKNENDSIVTRCAECGIRTGTLAHNVYAIVRVYRTIDSVRHCESDTQAICLSCVKKIGEKIAPKWVWG